MKANKVNISNLPKPQTPAPAPQPAAKPVIKARIGKGSCAICD